MPKQVTSKTFAQASTPSNRIVFTINSVTGENSFITDSDLQFTFAPNNASATPAAMRVQIYPTLIEKVIVSAGSLTLANNMVSVLGGVYNFTSGASSYDFSESGGLPITIQGTAPGNCIAWSTQDGTTAQVIIRGYQGTPRN